MNDDIINSTLDPMMSNTYLYEWKAEAKRLQAENAAQCDDIERLKKEINKLHEIIAYKNADIVRLQMKAGDE